jgi:hypothetical protein
MKEIFLLTLILGLTFLAFGVTLGLVFIKRNRNLKLTSLLLFITFIGLASWTGYKVIIKSYHKVGDKLKPRTGDEIYDALFDKRKTDCVKILNHQDQVVPKIDYAIWLHFETCPEELKRILSRHIFTSEKIPTRNWNEKIPYGETLTWFNPTTLGDTIMVYEYSTVDNRNIQTIWSSLDSTKVFCRDVLD